MRQPDSVPDTRSVLRQAVERLAAHHNCSPDEAREWIQQEARAKRASLDEVAKAVVAGQAISYRHSIPI